MSYSRIHDLSQLEAILLIAGFVFFVAGLIVLCRAWIGHVNIFKKEEALLNDITALLERRLLIELRDSVQPTQTTGHLGAVLMQTQVKIVQDRLFNDLANRELVRSDLPTKLKDERGSVTMASMWLSFLNLFPFALLTIPGVFMELTDPAPVKTIGELLLAIFVVNPTMLILDHLNWAIWIVIVYAVARIAAPKTLNKAKARLQNAMVENLYSELGFREKGITKEPPQSESVALKEDQPTEEAVPKESTVRKKGISAQGSGS